MKKSNKKETLKAITFNDVSTEVAQWLGDFYWRMRQEMSVFRSLCAVTEFLGENTNIKAGSRAALYLQDLPFAMQGLEERMLTILSDIDLFCSPHDDDTGDQ